MAGALDYEDDLCTVALIFRNIRILCNPMIIMFDALTPPNGGK